MIGVFFPIDRRHMRRIFTEYGRPMPNSGCTWIQFTICHLPSIAAHQCHHLR